MFKEKARLNGFSGANSKRLDHFITPSLVKDLRDLAIIHIGSNEITHNAVDQLDVKNIANRIIFIGKKCLPYSAKELIISSMFIKMQFKLTRILRNVNGGLSCKCKNKNKFQFMSNKNITREVLWRDGLHLNNDGANIFASNLAEFLKQCYFQLEYLTNWKW